jgi:hypothetical protein
MTTWRRWLRNVLVAAAATVVLTATGALPAAVTQVVDLAGFASGQHHPRRLTVARFGGRVWWGADEQVRDG